jgi:pimeloyl-ACP methyl ester carboxylesterase
MPKAFVHGAPEASAIWGALVEDLETRGIGDIHLLTPPGFGAPVPQGFEPNQSNYCDWLVAELEALGGDVDLMGHDWGAGHVFGALAARPDLIRSWATDSAGLIHAEYKWHDLAQAFQTPGVGEQAVEAMTGGAPADRAAMLGGFGVPSDTADLVAAGHSRCTALPFNRPWPIWADAWLTPRGARGSFSFPRKITSSGPSRCMPKSRPLSVPKPSP